MDVNIKVDVKETERLLKKVQRNIPFAASRAINDSMMKARNTLVDVDSHRYLDDVTRWTSSRRALRITWTRKNKLYGNIYIPEGREYLEWVIFGGKSVPYSNPKQKYLVEPGKRIRLNKYQNIPNKYLEKRRNKENYFFGKAGKYQTYGLWERTPKASTKLKLHASINRKSRNQKRIFPADVLAEKYIQRHMSLSFKIRLRQALK